MYFLGISTPQLQTKQGAWSASGCFSHRNLSFSSVNVIDFWHFKQAGDMKSQSGILLQYEPPAFLLTSIRPLLHDGHSRFLELSKPTWTPRPSFNISKVKSDGADTGEIKWVSRRALVTAT
jgi:hypothetical protein